MKKNILLLLFFTFSFLVAGQNTKVSILQEKIIRTIGQNPDSAKVYLLELIEYDEELSDSVMAFAYGRLGTSYGQLEQMDSARFYFEKGARRAKNHPNILGKIFKQSAQAERNFSNYDRAFSILEKAEKVYRGNNNLEGVAMVYVERASSYNYMAQEKKAIELLQKAIALFEEIGNSDNMIYAQQELAGTYANNGNYTFARDLYEDILSDVKSKTISINYYFTIINYAGVLSNIGEYSKAKRNYHKALQFFKENENRKYYYYVLGQIGSVYKKEKDYQNAKLYLSQAYKGEYSLKSVWLKDLAIDYVEVLNHLDDYKSSIVVFNQIQQIEYEKKLQRNDEVEARFLKAIKEAYYNMGGYKKALEVFEKANQLQDSIRLERDEIELAKIQEKYQNEYQRKENQILDNKNKLLEEMNYRKKIIIALIVLLVIIILSGVFFVIKKQKRVAELKTKTIESLESTQKYLKEKLNTEAILNRERRETLELRERELVANSMKMADFKNEISDVIKNVPLNNNLDKKIKSVLDRENNWSYFIDKFVNVYPDFINKLKAKYPDLSNNDLDFCALIKLRLSNKEIGNLLNIHHTSVISKRYRLRKKINNSNSELSLEEIIEQV